MTGLPVDDARWALNGLRVENRSSLIAAIEEVFAPWDTDELLAALDDAGIPAGRVRDLQQVYEWDQTASQGLLIEVDHATLGPVTLPGPPLRFFDGAGDEVTRTSHTAPPTLGQHSDTVREWLKK